MTLFQFGSIRFPHYQTSSTESLYFSGHALEKIDRHSVELKNIQSIFKVLYEGLNLLNYKVKI
jgi:hypothetical protein